MNRFFSWDYFVDPFKLVVGDNNFQCMFWLCKYAVLLSVVWSLHDLNVAMVKGICKVNFQAINIITFLLKSSCHQLQLSSTFASYKLSVNYPHHIICSCPSMYTKSQTWKDFQFYRSFYIHYIFIRILIRMYGKNF